MTTMSFGFCGGMTATVETFRMVDLAQPDLLFNFLGEHLATIMIPSAVCS